MTFHFLVSFQRVVTERFPLRGSLAVLSSSQGTLRLCCEHFFTLGNCSPPKAGSPQGGGRDACSLPSLLTNSCTPDMLSFPAHGHAGGGCVEPTHCLLH